MKESGIGKENVLSFELKELGLNSENPGRVKTSQPNFFSDLNSSLSSFAVWGCGFSWFLFLFFFFSVTDIFLAIVSLVCCSLSPLGGANCLKKIVILSLGK